MAAPAITSPPAGSTLAGWSDALEWTTNGAEVTRWWLYAGSSPGGNDYYDSGALAPSVLSRTVTGLPTDGSTVHVRLFYQAYGVWSQKDYEYVSAKIAVGYFNGHGGSIYQIGRAERRGDDLDAWVRNPDGPILSPGLGWDSGGVFQPFPVRVGGVIHLYYVGTSLLPQWGNVIGEATSMDEGLSFQKTGEGPVLETGDGGAWDSFALELPSVIYDEEDPDPARRWKMWYGGFDGTLWQTGYAYSADGLSWTKYENNPVLRTGAFGEWDDYVAEGFPVKFGDIWYMFYVGCRVNDGTGNRCQGGLAVSERPEGPYTKVPGSNGGPVLERRAFAAQYLTSDASTGSSAVSVADSSVFQVGEAVMLGDTDTYPFMSYVASIPTGTTVILSDPAPADFTTANSAALRSVYYGGVYPSSVYHDGTQWRMIVTVLQQFHDQVRLTEQSAYATSAALGASSWALDIANGVLLEPIPGTWDYYSAENLRLLPRR